MKIIELKNFLALCLPLMAAFLAQKGMQFIDTLMMGWIGPEALAAGALGTNIFMTILVFCRGALSSAGVSIVHARGSDQNHDIAFLLHQAFYLALCLSLPAMLIAWVSPNFLLTIGENALVAEDTRLLLQGLTFGIPAFLFFFILRELVSAFELTRIVMGVCAISIPLTFAANYILIYGKFGFPKLGIAGIGYGSAVVVWFMFACLLWYCRKKSILKAHLTFKLTPVSLKKMKELFVIGAPSGVILILDVGMFLAAALMLSSFGVAVLASYQIAMQCVSLAYNFPLAVSFIAALKVGHFASAKNWIQVKYYAHLGLWIGLVISLVVAALLISMPGAIIRFFLGHQSSQEIYSIAASFLFIVSFLLTFDALQTIINGVLRGLKDTFIPMLWSLFCYCIAGIGSAYFFGFYTSLKTTGIWLGLIAGMFSLSLVLFIRFRRLLFKIKDDIIFSGS